MTELNDLMKQLSDHKGGKAYYYQRESTVNTDDLMKGLNSRVDDLKAQHEAEAAAAQERQNHRRVQHPDQYEKLQMQKEALMPDQPDETPRMSEDEKRESLRHTLNTIDRKEVQRKGILVYNHNGMPVGYK